MENNKVMVVAVVEKLAKMQSIYCKFGIIIVILQRNLYCIVHNDRDIPLNSVSYTMLEPFFRIHDYLVEHSEMPIRRLLMDEIDWNDRLIAIKGGRGVGKTDFLLARAKEIESKEKPLYPDLAAKKHKSSVRHLCLYVNLNNFYFTEHSIVEFAGMFVKAGGHTLLLDQMFKYPNWSKELKKCYDKYKDLHIVFSASPVMRLIEENKDIANIVKMYNLRGFSFREYLNLQTGLTFRPYTLEDILHSHASIAREICEHVHPLEYFSDYLEHGYYPSYLELKNFEEDLLKTMNMMLEVDVLMIKQIDVACLPKLRRLLYIMLKETPCTLNVSNISEEIDLSRATTMNYIKYLKDARLLNLLYMEGKQFPMKPSKVYMQNTNIAYMIATRELSQQDVYETCFYCSLHGGHKVNVTERNAMFIVDGKYYFDVKTDVPTRESIRPCAVGNIETGRGNFIPLWLLGFLY